MPLLQQKYLFNLDELNQLLKEKRKLNEEYSKISNKYNCKKQ